MSNNSDNIVQAGKSLLAVTKPFPTEFRKNFWKQFNKNFLLLLALSLVAHLVVVTIMIIELREIKSWDLIQQNQRRFANLILEDQARMPEAVPMQELPLPTSDIILPGENLAGSGAAGAPGAAPGAKARARSAEMAGPNAEQLAAGQRAIGAEVKRRRAESDAMVGSGGLFQLLTTEGGYSGVLDYRPIADITQVADSTATELDRLLAKLDYIQVARDAKKIAELQQGGLDGEMNQLNRAAKDVRLTRRATTVEDLLGKIQPMEKPEEKLVARNEKYLNLSSSISDRPNIPGTAEEKARLIRTAEQVSTVIMYHNSAIQDCYIVQRRSNPYLKRGKITVRFAINPDGAVSWAEIVESSIGSEALENCILAKIRRWNDFGYGDPTAPDQIFRQVYVF